MTRYQMYSYMFDTFLNTLITQYVIPSISVLCRHAKYIPAACYRLFNRQIKSHVLNPSIGQCVLHYDFRVFASN